MKKHHRNSTAAFALAIASVVTTTHAADLYWQGGTADLGGPNYFEPISAASNVAPTDGDDALYIGADGTATSATDLSVGRIVVGHTGTSTESAPGAFPGAGTVNVTGGTLTTNLGSGIIPSGSGLNAPPAAGIVVGHTANGSFSISNATVNVNDSVVVGASLTDSTINASLAVNAGGTLNVNNGGLQLGGSGTTALAGAGGTLTVDGGTVNVSAAGADLVIGVWNRSTYVQTGGTVTVADETFVGRRNADFSSFTLNGGGTLNTRVFNVSDTTGSGRTDDVSVNIADATLNVTNGINIATGNARRTDVTVGGTSAVSSGTLTIGGTGSANTAVTFTGSSTLTGTGGLNIGNDTANNASITFSGNSIININNGLTAGLGSATNTTVTVAENATLNLATSGASNVHLFIGRGTANNTVLNVTGGNVNVPNYVLVGTATAGSTGTTTTNHSGGTITAGTNLAPTGPDPITVRVGFKIGDTAGSHTYNLSDTGAINVANGAFIVGRQGGSSTVNQTGGTVTANGGLHVGEAETATASFQTATGTYNISAGSINASVAGASPASYFTNALSVANAGTGTFRVIGDDATINVNGNVLVNALPAEDPTPARVGTLAYQLEAGDAGLSMISSTGIATFAAGSVLELDFNGLTPSATSFNLLTAVDIIDNGLNFVAPAGWSFEIVAGGNGELLRALTAAPSLPGDYNGDGFVGQDDLNLVLGNWGQTVTPGKLNGDGSGDGFVGQDDLNQILGSWGQGGAAAAALTAVPEPATLSLVGLGALATLARRRRA